MAPYKVTPSDPRGCISNAHDGYGFIKMPKRKLEDTNMVLPLKKRPYKIPPSVQTQLTTLKRQVRLAKPELKYATGTGSTVTPFASVCLIQVPQGTGQGQRSGNKICVKRIEVTISCNITPLFPDLQGIRVVKTKDASAYPYTSITQYIPPEYGSELKVQFPPNTLQYRRFSMNTNKTYTYLDGTSTNVNGNNLWLMIPTGSNAVTYRWRCFFTDA
jgi:hypothetical protein